MLTDVPTIGPRLASSIRLVIYLPLRKPFPTCLVHASPGSASGRVQPRPSRRALDDSRLPVSGQLGPRHADKPSQPQPPVSLESEPRRPASFRLAQRHISPRRLVRPCTCSRPAGSTCPASCITVSGPVMFALHALPRRLVLAPVPPFHIVSPARLVGPSSTLVRTDTRRPSSEPTGLYQPAQASC